MIDEAGGEVVLRAKVDYRSGDQVFMSYGDLDLYTHAVNYNYYDENAQHRLRADKHFYIRIVTAAQQRALASLGDAFKVAIKRTASGTLAVLMEPDAYATMNGPSQKFWRFIEALCAAGYMSDPRLCYQSLLESAAAGNHVEQFNAKFLPRRYKRFYAVLQKQKAILAANRDWVSSK